MDDRGAPPPVPRPQATGPDPLIGRMINDRYRIVGTIARGGMGKVYRAEQQPLGRLVALKVLNPNYTGENDPEFHKRFFLEASIASKLTHPNTVTIFDYGKNDDEIFYIAMELLEGRTLHRALREEGPFRPDRAMHIARQICRSLREAHSLGVIHRDLKPANVYLVQHGDESDFVKVLDFGLVKNLDDKPGEELTQTGLFMGSPKYMSPEQIRGERVDARVDVYALGVILFEMLTGKVPFDRANSVNILMAHIQEEIPSIAAFNPNVLVPPMLENVVRRCMAKDPVARYSSMDEVLAALKHCSGVSGTMSGEFRVQDLDSSLTQISMDGPMPSSTAISTRGEMLSGGTPYRGAPQNATPSGVATLSGNIALPSGSQALPAQAMPQQPAPSSKGKLLGAGVLLLALAGGAFAYVSSQKLAPIAKTEQPATNVAPSLPATAAQPTPTAPIAQPEATQQPVTAPQPNPAATAMVLVSLRSTPPGAMVVVGEREYGPTPTQVEWTGADAAIGREVTFRFQRKGYRDLTVTRQIRGEHLDVEAPPMDPVAVKRPAREEHPTTVVAPPKPAAPIPSLKGYKAEPY